MKCNQFFEFVSSFTLNQVKIIKYDSIIDFLKIPFKMIVHGFDIQAATR